MSSKSTIHVNSSSTMYLSAGPAEDLLGRFQRHVADGEAREQRVAERGQSDEFHLEGPQHVLARPPAC